MFSIAHRAQDQMFATVYVKGILSVAKAFSLKSITLPSGGHLC